MLYVLALLSLSGLMWFLNKIVLINNDCTSVKVIWILIKNTLKLWKFKYCSIVIAVRFVQLMPHYSFKEMLKFKFLSRTTEWHTELFTLTPTIFDLGLLNTCNKLYCIEEWLQSSNDEILFSKVIDVHNLVQKSWKYNIL